MSQPVHIVEQVDGSQFAWTDRVRVAALNAVNSGATGATTSTAKAVTFNNYELPANYSVQVTPNGTTALFATVSAKTNNGFTVTLFALTGDVPANATFDVIVFA